MEIEGVADENRVKDCIVSDITSKINQDNGDESRNIFVSGAKTMVDSEPIMRLSVSDNPSNKTTDDVQNEESYENTSGEREKLVVNITEPMVIAEPIFGNPIHDSLPSISRDETKFTSMKNVDESITLCDSNVENILVSESITPHMIDDDIPRITADVGNSNTDEDMNDDQTEIGCNDIQSIITTTPNSESSAAVDHIGITGDVGECKNTEHGFNEGSETAVTNIESMVIATPTATAADGPVGDRGQEVQMTDALRGIATAYSDSSDDEEETHIVEEQIINSEPIKNVNYRCKKSDDDTDSEEDSSSESSSSDSASASTDGIDSDSDDEDIKSNDPKKRRERKKSERGEYDKLPPIEDLKISVPEVLCNPVGKVGWMVDQMVVVTQLKETKALNPTLNIDTVLFIERGRRVLGRIFDVFGTVSDPHYCVRFNDAQHIKENNIEVGMTVYYCPNTPYTSLVFMADLLKMKASDDVGDDEHPAFSDDEEERAYYSSLKQKQANNNTKGIDKNTEVPKKRICTGNDSGWKSKHPWNNERRTHQKQQHHRNSRNHNNMQQQSTWQYPPVQYNHWMPNPAFHNWPRPFSMESGSHYSAPSFQSNVNFPQQPRPSFIWPNNGMTFTPTQTQSAPWRAVTPSPPPFPPLQSPPPPPPGIQ